MRTHLNEDMVTLSRFAGALAGIESVVSQYQSLPDLQKEPERLTDTARCSLGGGRLG